MRDDFMFDGRYGSSYNLLICNINGSTEDSNIVSDNNFSTFQPAKNDKNYFISSNYSSVLTKNIQVCKTNNCQIVDITDYDVESISRWLCREDGYHRFAFVNKDGENTIEYNAKININKIELGNGIIGLELTITTDSQYGYTKRKTEIILDENQTVCINNTSSKLGKIKVNMQLLCDSDGDYIITHTFGDKSNKISFKNCVNGEYINVSDMCVLTSSISSHDISNDFNYIFPFIQSTISDTKNYFKSNLPCKLTIEYELRRKVGI